MSVVLASIVPLTLYLLLKNKAAYKAKLRKKAAFKPVPKDKMSNLVPARSSQRQPFLSTTHKRPKDNRMQQNYKYNAQIYTNELGEKFRIKENVPLAPTRNYSMLDDGLLSRKNMHLVEPHSRDEVAFKYTELPKTKQNRLIAEAYDRNDQVSRNMNGMQMPGEMQQRGGPSGFSGKVNNLRADPFMPETTRGEKDDYEAAIGARPGLGNLGSRSKINEHKRNARAGYGDNFDRTVSAGYRARIAPARGRYPKPRLTKRGNRNYRV